MSLLNDQAYVDSPTGLPAMVPLAPQETATHSDLAAPLIFDAPDVDKDDAGEPTFVTPETLTDNASFLPTKPKDARYQTLDIVRGMACLMLLAYHAAFYADHSWSSKDPGTWTAAGLAINVVGRMWMGVPMFFVVSGYCIAASVDSLRRKPHSLASYFYRRFRRIYPPLWAALMFGVVFTLIAGLDPETARQCLQLPKLSSFAVIDWIANTTATTSWLPMTLGETKKYLLPNTWTLCYEEQFYAVTGLLLLISGRRFFQGAYVLAMGTVAARHLCRYYGVAIDGFFFDGHWLLFTVGILLYHRVNYLNGRAAWMALGAMVIGAGYGLAERLFAIDAHDRHVGEYLFVAGLFSALLVVAKPWDANIAPLACLRPIRWCGTISYSLYLTHFPITVWIACRMAMAGWHSDGWVLLGTIPICLAISVGVAWVFHQIAERPFINAPVR